METAVQGWPEPVVRVQSLANSGITRIPERYVKPPSHRPASPRKSVDIPIIDLQHAYSSSKKLRETTLSAISTACREVGFFQVVNHGVNHQLMRRNREVWREFFHLPMAVKQMYANSPATYEGYGSRLGVEIGANLDWSDYFFLHYLPSSLKNPNKWPTLPQSCRGLVAEYGDELTKLSMRLMKLLSLNLGMKEDDLLVAFGGSEGAGACLRANFYPKCPQPDLALGLSAHSDPGGMTILLADQDVAGLEVHLGDEWVTVKPTPNSFVVNIGDQIQILSNGLYKSVEHRVLVNSEKERISLAFFFNPAGELVISPSELLVSDDRPALYSPMTFNEYRQYIRKKGICVGKISLSERQT